MGNTGMIDPSPRHTRRHKFRPFVSLRGQLVVIVVLAIWMGWFIRKVNVQRGAVAAILRAGGSVHYDAEYDIGNGLQRRVLAPRWLTESLGIDFCSTVDMVSYQRTGADELAGHVAKLPGLHTVDFGLSDLSDAGLSQLRDLDLTRLLLSKTKVTDAGIRHLHGMTKLELLDLDKTSVGDGAMANLTSLPKLSFLLASDTQVGDLGANSIAKFPTIKVADLEGTQVGDAGAARLKSLPALLRLQLSRSRVSPLMMKQLYPSFFGATASPGR